MDVWSMLSLNLKASCYILYCLFTVALTVLANPSLVSESTNPSGNERTVATAPTQSFHGPERPNIS